LIFNVSKFVCGTLLMLASTLLCLVVGISDGDTLGMAPGAG